ncbi:MAG: geranylgeranyl reductase [Planctomycetaceae bacterium]|nr:geranylgeranyl reductase [Planctomycetaceae bacterium]
METCDVLIVGGGPAGSACAWKLRWAGVDVMVLDKATFPRHKVCAGWITPAVLDELDIDVQDYQRSHVIQPITRFLTGIIGRREVETKYDCTVSYGIRRWEFDDYLLRRSGARLRMGEAFRSIREERGSWIVNDSICASAVIGAGGHFCPVNRYFLTNTPNSVETESSAVATATSKSKAELPVVVAQEVEFELSPVQREHCTVLPDRPELFFCPDLRGYGWIFRKGNWLNIGLGRESESHLSTHIADFVKTLQSRGKIPDDIPGPFHGHAYHLRTHLRPSLTPDGILVIGDAAGLADRQSGEGIRPAIESGLLAAVTILETEGENKASWKPMFAEKMRRRFGETSTSGGITSYVPTSMKELAARWLMSSHWFNRRVVLDQWFLHRKTPALRV